MQKLLIVFFMGFFVGNAFADDQPKSESTGDTSPGTQLESKDRLPEHQELSTTKDKKASPNAADEAKPHDEAVSAPHGDNAKSRTELINIKVSDTAGSASAVVTEILVQRGEWVQSGKIVAILTTGEKDIYVKSPGAGVIMKIHAKQGDSVSRGTAVVQLKKTNVKRSDFQLSWKIFSLINVSVSSVGKRIGGKVGHNIDIPEVEKGKWKNACSIRISLVLNHTGFPIKHGKYPTVSGEKEGLYIYRFDDMVSYLRDIFGNPDIVVNNAPKPEDFGGMKGILVVTGNGRGDARGHVTLWNGSECADTCHLVGDENNRTFVPLKAALWVLP